MLRRLLKAWHLRRGYCGYLLINDPRLKQGLFYCHHCKAMRFGPPVLTDEALDDVLAEKADA